MRSLITLGVFALLCLLQLGSCGIPVTEDVRTYVKEFDSITGRTSNSTILFTDLSGKTIGLCAMGLNLIYLDKSYYESATIIQRKSLVFHELGHCVCHLFHTVETDTFCPSSLMSPVTTTNYCLKLNWKKYLKDLRARCQK